MNYRTTDPIGHSMAEEVSPKYHRPTYSNDMTSAGRAQPQPDQANSKYSRRSLSGVSSKPLTQAPENDNAAYAQKMIQNEKEFMNQQKQYLGSQYQQQQREKEMMDRLQSEQKKNEQQMMKKEEQHMKSIEHIIKRSEMASQRALLDEYGSNIKQKENMRNIEKEVEKNHSMNQEFTARQSLYNEKNQRKEVLDQFKNDFKADYDERMKTKANAKYDKTREQQEYQRLFDENAQREIANEQAYKKRFKDFDKNLARKNEKFYDIVNDKDKRRDDDVLKIAAPDKTSFYDYYNDREKKKLQKAEVMKVDTYQNMKNTIDMNHRTVHELGKQRREDAQRSAQELQQFLDDEKQRKANERIMQQQYRGILETQVRMKNQAEKSDLQGFDDSISQRNGGSSGTGEMYMVPGINSVSPYLKQQRKGQMQLGEHMMKMRQFIDTEKNLPMQSSLTAHPSTRTIRDNKSVEPSLITPKREYNMKAQISQRDMHPTTQEMARNPVLTNSGKYSLIGNGTDLRYDPITNPIPNLNKNPYNIQSVGLAGDKSMTDNLIRRAQNLGQGIGLKRSYNF